MSIVGLDRHRADRRIQIDAMFGRSDVEFALELVVMARERYVLGSSGGVRVRYQGRSGGGTHGGADQRPACQDCDRARERKSRPFGAGGPFLDFAKRRPSTGLNFGDCFVYALAKAMGEALLFRRGFSQDGYSDSDPFYLRGMENRVTALSILASVCFGVLGHRVASWPA